MPAFDFPPSPSVGQPFTPPGSDLIYVWTGVTWNSTIATGSGTVTQIDTGAGLEGGPITTTGTISMTDTAVIPGSYNAANITIDQQGRITAAAQGQSSGVLIQDTPPVGPITGNLWWDSSTDNSGGRLYVYYTDENSAQWVNTNPSGGDAGGGGNSSVSVLPSAPPTPEQGDLWFCTSDGRLYVFYDDGDTSQWVDASPDSLQSVVNSGAEWPATSAENDLFFRTTDGRLYIYYKDTDGMQWVDASPDAPPSEYWTRDSATGIITPLVSTDGVVIGDPANTYGVQFNHRGAAYIRADGLANATDIALGIYNGGFQSTDTTAFITKDGSATFENPVRVNRSVSGNLCFATFTGGTNTPATSAINSDGSATFATGDFVIDLNGAMACAGPVTINDPANTSGHFFGAGGGAEHTVASGTVGTTPVLSVIKGFGNSTFQVTADGSANFASGSFDIASNGVAAIYNQTSTPGDNLLITRSDVNGSNTLAFFVTANGVISARNDTISLIGSERRIKNTIEPLDPVTSWETVRDLPYYSYKLNGNDENTYYGAIVDECPEEMVVEGATSDEEGNIRTYDNSLLQGRLFVALQTALTRIEALEETNASLEERLIALEGGTN